MANFPGGSAYAMAQSIVLGNILVTPILLKRFSKGEVKAIEHELGKLAREIAGEIDRALG